jgi:hypothetical protein
MAAPIWQNLISHRTTVDPLELLPQEHNFRIHALNQRQVTTASLDELGHVGDIIVNIRTGKIVNGHLRVELAIAEGQERVPVTYIDCDEATEKIILAFFDQVGEKAITDADRLRRTIAQIDIGSTHLQASLDDWLLSFKPKKAGKKGAAVADDDEGEELDDEEEFFETEPTSAPVAVAPAVTPAPAAAPAPAPAPIAVAPAPAPAATPEPTPAAAPAAPEPTPVAALAAPVVEDGETLVVAAPTLASQPLGGDDGDGEAEGVAPSHVAPIAPAPAAPVAPTAPTPTPAPAPAPTLKVVQDDPIAAAIVEDARAAAAEDTATPPPPPASVIVAPSEYLVKVGEFDQMVPAAVFAPWFAALCAQVGNGHTQLSAEVRRRLGFE